MKQPMPNLDAEFERIIQQMRKSWDNNQIQEFLMNHMRLNQLFSHKLQTVIDNTGHIVHEYKMDIDPAIIDKIDKFNKNCVQLDNAENPSGLVAPNEMVKTNDIVKTSDEVKINTVKKNSVKATDDKNGI